LKLLLSGAHLVKRDLVAANLVTAFLPPLDLQNKLHSTIFFTIVQPLTTSPTHQPPSPPASQDNSLSYLHFHQRYQYTSLPSDDGQSSEFLDRHRRCRARYFTTPLISTSSKPPPSPTTTMTSLAAAASALTNVTKTPGSPTRAYASFKDALMSPPRDAKEVLAAAPVISPEDQLDKQHHPSPTNTTDDAQAASPDRTAPAASGSVQPTAGTSSQKRTNTSEKEEAPKTPRGSASNSFRRKVRDGKADTNGSARTEAKTYAYAYWSPSAPENRTGGRVDKDGEKRLRLASNSSSPKHRLKVAAPVEDATMAINSPVRVDRTAGSNELVQLVREHPGHLDQDDLNEKEVSSNNSVQSVHSGHSDADSLEAHVQEVEDDLASLDGDSASTSNKPTNNPGRA
jgi:hypothetical protein